MPLVPHERFYALLYRNLIALYKVGIAKWRAGEDLGTGSRAGGSLDAKAVVGGIVWHVACLIGGSPLSGSFLGRVSRDITRSNRLGVSNNEAT
jgi:hypothetical protein